LHPGEADFSLKVPDAPGQFVGWTSLKGAKDFERDFQAQSVDNQLANSQPSLRYGTSWRSFKWRIKPDDFGLGLRLIEAISTDDVSDWSPSVILAQERDLNQAWVKIALAIDTANQQQFNDAFEQANHDYSTVGYRIVVRGYSAFLDNCQSTLRSPAL
jgi:hypothetical protein